MNIFEEKSKNISLTKCFSNKVLNFFFKQQEVKRFYLCSVGDAKV